MYSNMVEIEYKPINKIVVHEIIKQPLTEFIRMKARPSNPNIPNIPARWAEGIVFVAGAYPPTPELVNEQVQGTVHWSDMEFAEMEDYQQILTDQDSGGSVRVTNYSSNSAVTALVRWLKKQPQWFGSAAAA